MKIPYEHQPILAEQAYTILREYGLVYLAMEERTGKTLTSLLAMEKSDKVNNVLIVSKKKALPDWESALEDFSYLLSKSYTLINYHSVDKVEGPFDAAILDEPHAYIASYPKPSTFYKKVRKLVYGLPLIYNSATPHAQGYQMLYHQLALSKWSPFRKFKNFYEWFREYAKRDKDGRLQLIRISAERSATDYTALDEAKVVPEVEHLFIVKTRKELGFEHEPEDELHYITLSDSIREVYNTILDDNILKFIVGDTEHLLVCDSPMKLRTSLHMLEGGGLKINDVYIELSNREKIDYILKTWGDIEDLVIMYNYTGELDKLQKIFKKARILQATSYAEGVDLSMHKHLVVYSMDFSTSKYTQRRARQANMERKEEILVHFLLVKKAISEQVYKTVAKNKTNFVDSVFERERL